MKSVVVDSNYLIALVNGADFLHQRALALAEKFPAKTTTFLVSEYVFLETLTVVSQRLGKSVALELGAVLQNNDQFEVVHIDTLLFQGTWDIFQAVTSKNVSFVDANLLAILKAKKAKQLLSFDETDFKPLQKKYGFSLIS